MTSIANGGGDISDLGPRTVWRNLAPNGGARVNSEVTKAGVPADADYAVAPPIATRVLDTTGRENLLPHCSATRKGARA